jgi:hypothetical protein
MSIASIQNNKDSGFDNSLILRSNFLNIDEEVIDIMNYFNTRHLHSTDLSEKEVSGLNLVTRNTILLYYTIISEG